MEEIKLQISELRGVIFRREVEILQGGNHLGRLMLTDDGLNALRALAGQILPTEDSEPADSPATM